MSGVPFPYFDGINVSEFLRNFKDFCDDYGYAPEQRTVRVIRYCAGLISAYLRSLPKYAAKEWEDMKAIMLKEWEQEDNE